MAEIVKTVGIIPKSEPKAEAKETKPKAETKPKK